MDSASGQDPQRRVLRIEAFRSELATLEAEGGLVLTSEQRARLVAHHGQLLVRLAGALDLEAGATVGRVSWAMRLAALLGGAALLAALVLFLHRIWVHLPAAVQWAVLAGAPLTLLGTLEWASRRGWPQYYLSLLALAAGVLFVLELNALGTVWNLAPTPHALLTWSLFAVFVGHAVGARLVLGAGLVLACAYAGTLWLLAKGAHFSGILEHPRHLLPAAAVVYVVPWMLRGRFSGGWAGVYRFSGAALACVALLVESLSEHAAWGVASPRRFAMVAQLAGLGVGAGLVFHGIRLAQGELVRLGAAAFVVFLYARLHAWCWSWMPKYLFFLMVGLLGLGVVLVLRRLRWRWTGKGAP